MGIEIGKVELSLEDRIEFFRTLSSWLTSGGGAMPVSEGIANTCEVFSRDEYKTMRRKMERIADDFRNGVTTLTKGLRMANVGFTGQELSIIEAAEKSSQLRTAVPALVEALEMRFNARKMLVGKLTMPLVGGFMLILLSLGVMIFMMPAVVGPVIARNPEVMESFPVVIQYYWYTSVWIKEFWIIPATVIAFPIVALLLRNTSFMKPYVQNALMRFGPTRRVILAFNGVMIVYFMPALVRSGMPMPEVLRTMSGALDNIKISNGLRSAASEHEQGYKLGEVLARLPIRGSFRSAVEAGEKQGKIAERVEDLKIPFTNEFDRLSRKMVNSITMIVMAVLMPLFIISVYTTLVTPMIALMEYS